MEAINAVSCIKGEIHSIVTLMRLNSRWSQQSSRLSDGATVGSGDENPIIKSFRKLNEYLEGMFDLREVDCVMYLSPFHQVIISEKASGVLTSATLNSVSKFVTYGFLSPHFPRAREGIALIASCISHCVFEESDWESDEVILMKLLELSTLCLRCDASRLLNVRAAWEIYSTCISVQSQYRASKILRSEAETALRNLTLMTFSRAHSALKIYSQTENDERGDQFLNLDEGTDFGFFVNVRGNSWETLSESYDFEGPVGVTLLLGKIMTVFSSLMDSSARTADGVKFALTLVNIALEAGGPALGTVAPLVDVLRGDVCRHLLRASQSDDLAVFSLALRVVFNLFVSIKDHMKVQLEVFLTSVHLRLLTPSQAQLTGSGKNSKSTSSISAYTASLAKEELALESLLEFCREPSLMEDLYTNYDCDVQCTNLFDSIISVLCIRAAPMGIQRIATPFKSTNATPKGGGHNFEPPSLNVNTSNAVRVSILNKLALDGVFAVLHSIAVKCEKSHRSKRAVKNISNLLKAEAEIGMQPEAGDHLDSSVCSPFSEAPSPRLMVESAGLLVDQWCEVDDVSDSQKSVERNTSSPAVSADSGLGSGSRPVRGSDLHLTHPGTSPSPAQMLASSSDSQKDIRALTSAALSAHSSSSNSSSSASVRLPFTVSTSSTPRASQLIVRGSNSSPFSANTSVDGRVDIVSSGDDDADFFLLARAKTAEVLRQRKLKKQRLRLASEKFNEKPLKPDWVHFALSLGLLRPAATIDRSHSETKKDEKDKVKIVDQFAFADAESVAKFLRNTPGLGKTQVGEFLSKGPKEMYPYNAEVMRLYVDTFDFGAGSKCSFDKALRTFLGSFRLPGEAQCIDRLMEAFAQKLFRDLGVGNPFASGDAAFILAFSTIMLNTDLHNPNLPQAKRMTKDQFFRNNKGINDGKDLPREYLENLYDDIKSDQIKMDIDLTDSDGAALAFTDSNLWNKMLRKSTLDQVPAAFTPTMSARLRAMASKNKANAPSIFPAGAHEKDMFVATAVPVLGAMLAVWEVTDEDLMIRRITENLWTYASICIGFNLKGVLNSLVSNLSARVLSSLISSRSSPSQLLAVESSVSEVYRARITNLTNLLNLNFESLIASTTREGDHSTFSEDGLFGSHSPNTTGGAGAGAGAGTDEIKMNWRETHRLRGEVMLRLVFHIASCCSSSLSADSWGAITQLLLYVRNRGVLPASLATLTVEFRNHSAGGPFQFGPSEAALDCHFAARGTPRHLNAMQMEDDDDYGPSFLWGSVYTVASLGGMLFQSSPSASTPSAERVPDERDEVILDGNSCAFSRRNMAMDLPNQSQGVQRNVGYAFDNLLRISIAATHVDTLLFRMTVDVDSTEFAALINTLLALLRSSVEDLLSSKVVSNASISKSHPQYRQYLDALCCSGNKEVDAVVLLVWISRIITANKPRVHLVWPKMHDFYREIIEEKVDSACVKCPYFLEHCIMTVLKLVSLISHTAEARKSDVSSSNPSQDAALRTDKESSAFTPYRDPKTSVFPVKNEVQGPWAQIPWGAGQSSPMVLTPSAMHSGLQSVWLSLRLIRGVPSSILHGLADRLGAGVIGILNSHGVGCSGISTLEQWYLIFSFLSVVASAPLGRPYAWEAVRYLISSNAINDMNFTPCRHLVLRFLQGSFPADDSNEGTVDLRSWIKPSAAPPLEDAEMRMRQEESLDLLIGLNAMAMGGYRSKETLKSGTGKDKEDPAPPVFPASTRPSVPGTGLVSPDTRGAYTYPRGNRSSIEFAKTQEVELLWLETVKIFADVCGDDYKPLATKAVKCLQVIYATGDAACLPDGLWSRAVGEMLTRLPLGIAHYPSRVTGGGSDPCDRCTRCCRLLYELFVTHIMQLHVCPDFKAYWCKFTSILASNAGAVEKSPETFEHFMEMIIGLFQLLKPRPFSRVPERKVTREVDAVPASVPPAPLMVPPVAAPAPSAGLFGMFSLWGQPAPAPTLLQKGLGTADSAGQKSPADNSLEETDELEEITLLETEKHDGDLLSFSWRNALSITPSLSAALKQRNLDLLRDLNRCCDNVEATYVLPSPTPSSSSLTKPPAITAPSGITSGPFDTGRNTQVAEILAKKTPIHLIPVPTAVTDSHGAKLNPPTVEIAQKKTSQFFAIAKIDEPIAPRVELGHFSNGDKIIRSSAPSPNPTAPLNSQLLGIGSSSSSSSSSVRADQGQVQGLVQDPRVAHSIPVVTEIEPSSGPTSLLANTALETHRALRSEEELLTSLNRVSVVQEGDTPSSEHSGTVTLGTTHSDSRQISAQADTALETHSVDQKVVLPTDQNSPSSLTTSEGNYIIPQPSRAASRKINDRTLIV